MWYRTWQWLDNEKKLEHANSVLTGLYDPLVTKKDIRRWLLKYHPNKISRETIDGVVRHGECTEAEMNDIVKQVIEIYNAL
jgi:hypothetical protein